MADALEENLTVARRHVREREEQVARQLVLVKKLDLASREDDARSARELLATLTETLHAGRRHLQIEIEAAQRRKRSSSHLSSAHRPQRAIRRVRRPGKRYLVLW